MKDVLHWLDLWVVVYPPLLCLYVMVAASLRVLAREGRSPAASGPPPGIAVLVPAHNEELVIASCIESLLASTHPRVEIHVISDGSTDATARIAAGFAGRGVIVHEHVDNMGKSRALESALAMVHSELVMVVDADTRMEPGALSLMAAEFADPRVVGATANVRIRDPRGLLAKIQMVEYASIIGLLKRANAAWGGLFTVSGAACCFRTATIRMFGGFQSESITEDIELSWRLQAAGHKLVYVPAAIAHVEAPDSLRGLWSQRCRWSQGLVEVLRVHGAVWRGQSLALAVFAVEATLSIFWVFALLVATLWDLSMLWHHNGDLGHFLIPGFWQWLSVGMFSAQTALAMLYDSHYARLPWKYFPLALIYPVYFVIIILPSGLLGWGRGMFSHHAGKWKHSERH